MPPVIQQSLVLKMVTMFCLLFITTSGYAEEKSLPACRVYLSLWTFRKPLINIEKFEWFILKKKIS